MALLTFDFRLLFSSDNIGKNMRFHSEVIRFNDNGSVYDINIYAMYEGSDFRQELILVLQIFYGEKKDHRVLLW